MKRRLFVAGLGGLAALRSMPLAAQQPERRPTVAVLSPRSADFTQHPESPENRVIQSLAELGDVNGKNIDIRSRFADGDYQRLPKLAADLAALNPVVIYTFTTPGGRAAVGATSTIPIVLGPVGAETMHALVADFAHPGANLTGAHITGKAEHEKCLQLLKEAVPSVSRVGVLFNPQNSLWKGYPEVLAETARSLGIELLGVHATGPTDIDEAFADVVAKGVNSVFALGDATLIGGPGPAKVRILELLASNRLPSVSDDQDFAPDGGLLSLAADELGIDRAVAKYIHRILHGATPAELPIMSPKLLVTVNLAAAAKIGIAIPQQVIARADTVIR
jgi:putative tryptophan/tyrosine transport system substrate-binding protein